MVSAAVLPSLGVVINKSIHISTFIRKSFQLPSLQFFIKLFFFMYFNQIIYHNILNREGSIRIQLLFMKVYTGLER